MADTQKQERVSLIDYLRYPARSTEWDMIIGEVKAVQEAYGHWDKAIPPATRQRMARRIVRFREQWQGYKPDHPLEKTNVLNENERRDSIKSFNDLLEHHSIIEAHYGHPDKVPDLTRKAMKQEEMEYRQEVATHSKSHKGALRGDFLTRLNTIRQQQPQRKPK